MTGTSACALVQECIDAFDVELDSETLKEVDEVHVRMRNPNSTD